MAKLILDYIKVLVWPVVVFIAFLSLRSEIGELTNRASSVQAGTVSVEFSSTSTGRKEANEETQAPEIWFDFQNIDITHAECLTRGEKALEENGFTQGGINNGNTAFGYYREYAGAIWCVEPINLALVAVSGPSSKMASEIVAGVKNSFQTQP